MQLKYIPNVISLVRLSAVPVLIWLAFAQEQRTFAWLLLAAGLSDVLDGWIARRFEWTSALGALLDSIADLLLIIVSLYGIWQLQSQVFLNEWLVFSSVIVIWTIVHVTALVRYGRLASFHTRLAQFGMLMFGTFVMVLLFFDFFAWFFYITAAICFLGGIESLVMIVLVPAWTPDVREGLPAILRKRQGSRE